MRPVTFIKFDICHLNEALGMLYSVTFTYEALGTLYSVTFTYEALGMLYSVTFTYEALGMLYSVTLTYIFKISFINISISETIRTSVKMHARTFIKVGIRHRMASLLNVVRIKIGFLYN